MTPIEFRHRRIVRAAVAFALLAVLGLAYAAYASQIAAQARVATHAASSALAHPTLSGCGCALDIVAGNLTLM